MHRKLTVIIFALIALFVFAANSYAVDKKMRLISEGGCHSSPKRQCTVYGAQAWYITLERGHGGDRADKG